ncbi:hypothetical protein CK203_087626 [Vitis vinifera]|uniref:Uncharacterized protein n=1 Tax=Vitis vinifera TaxID=29760 RepID=A0A438C770_VITVI|nr:hypothetical protein CK203_087626 [Vitis vinifera]
MPEAISTNPPATPSVPLAAPSTSEAFITISATKFRAMIHLFKTLTTTHNALFRQMSDIPRPLEPIAPAKEAIPTEETTRVDVPPKATHEAAIEPSSPSKSPAH